jgi:hypothetical protein
VDRYELDKVQPGTIAAKKIAEGESGDHEGDDIDMDSTVEVPQDGQQSDDEEAPPISGEEAVNETHSSGGIDQNELYAAMEHAAKQTGQTPPPEETQRLWEEWMGWDRRPEKPKTTFYLAKWLNYKICKMAGQIPDPGKQFFTVFMTDNLLQPMAQLT